MQTSHKPVIGIIESVSIVSLADDVLAKIDTGADSSAIWASDIHVTNEGLLSFKLFDKGHPAYSGESVVTNDFTATSVRSSNGQSEIRYRTTFSVRLGGKQIRMRLNLSDRSKNEFKMLIGRRSISGKFLVDVSLGKEHLPKAIVTRDLRSELSTDPVAFHNKYMKKEV